MKISLGSGGLRFDGWTHVDADPQWQPDVLADLREPLPFPDASAALMHSEDFLGQLSPGQARAFFADCHRVLRPGGLLRVLTPDLREVVSLYLRNDPRLLELWQREVGIPLQIGTLGEVVNLAVTFANQQFLFDEDSLRAVAEPAGFTVYRVGYRSGSNPELAALDQRSPENALSMYFDCVKA